jgi:gluconate 2-dehydrogenase gamma chain
MITNKLQLSSPDDVGSGMPRPPRVRSGIRRRELMLTTATTLLFSTHSVLAGVVRDSLPWEQNAGAPPTEVKPGPWTYFTAEEAAAVEALVDRLIPPDPQAPGGKDAGCAVSTDNLGTVWHRRAIYARALADGTAQQAISLH